MRHQNPSSVVLSDQEGDQLLQLGLALELAGDVPTEPAGDVPTAPRLGPVDVALLMSGTGGAVGDVVRKAHIMKVGLDPRSCTSA